MNIWPIERLEDVCNLVTDGTHYSPPDVGSGVPFLTVKDMTDEGLDFINCIHIAASEYEKAVKGNSAPTNGDVLFSKDGTVGKVHVVNQNNHFAVLSSIAILRPNSGLIRSDYLGWIMRDPTTLAQASKKKTGSALKRIILNDLKQVTLSLPPLSEQRHIATILDKADAIRRKQQRVMERMEDFLRSVFLDMFGDPVSNPKGWQVAGLGTVALRFSDGPFGSNLKTSHYVDAGVRVVRLQNIGVGQFLDEDKAFVSEQHFS